MSSTLTCACDGAAAANPSPQRGFVLQRSPAASQGTRSMPQAQRTLGAMFSDPGAASSCRTCRKHTGTSLTNAYRSGS
eukprot:9433173-Alexandrium_andersonii.AAC.1